MNYFYLKLKSLFLLSEESKQINLYEQYIALRLEQKRLLGLLPQRFPDKNKTQTEPFQVTPYKRINKGDIITIDTLDLH